jgi:hypothetical protein
VGKLVVVLGAMSPSGVVVIGCTRKGCYITVTFTATATATGTKPTSETDASITLQMHIPSFFYVWRARVVQVARTHKQHALKEHLQSSVVLLRITTLC